MKDGGELLEGCRGKGKGKGLKSEDSLLVKSLNCDLTPNPVKQGAGVGGWKVRKHLGFTSTGTIKAYWGRGSWGAEGGAGFF